MGSSADLHDLGSWKPALVLHCAPGEGGNDLDVTGLSLEWNDAMEGTMPCTE